MDVRRTEEAIKDPENHGKKLTKILVNFSK